MPNPEVVVPAEKIRQGTLPNEEIDQLVAAMRTGEAWQAALSRLQLPELQRKPYWFSDLNKARFYHQLPVANHTDALDIGAGSGVISAGLSPHFDRVSSLEHNGTWSEFMRLRFAQDKLANITVVHGSALPLPFADESFDLIVVNGVLEWIPEAAPASQSPREAQVGFLQDVRRKLRPGGMVGVAIENRLCLENFRGGSPHGEPPYVAIMPRPMAEWRTRKLTGRSYRTWIYGPAGYRALFRDAGFAGLEIQPVLPSYHQPSEVVDLSEGPRIRKYFNPDSLLKRMVLDVASATGMVGSLVHSFYLTARK